MELKVLRLGDNDDATIGAFYINGILRSMTIEDQEQKEAKVMHETRIPDGTYNVTLRDEGGFNKRYKDKYNDRRSKHYQSGDFHRGMLAIHNMPDYKIYKNGFEFQYILIHVGNTDAHTSGCLLLNYAADVAGYTGSRSGDAYVELYPEIRDAVLAGEPVTIQYIDVETGK